jgi:hypothetical protein
MKTLIIILLALTICSGCATLKYESADGTKITYTRFFTTSEKVDAKIKDGSLKMGNQTIDTATLQSLIKLLATP